VQPPPKPFKRLLRAQACCNIPLSALPRMMAATIHKLALLPKQDETRRTTLKMGNAEPGNSAPDKIRRSLRSVRKTWLTLLWCRQLARPHSDQDCVVVLMCNSILTNAVRAIVPHDKIFRVHSRHRFTMVLSTHHLCGSKQLVSSGISNLSSRRRR
jgi:hypothetical protein